MMRERILSWGDDFAIKNTAGEDVWHVDGKALSFGDKLSFKDRHGTEVAFIDQKLLSIGPQYHDHPWRQDRRRRKTAAVHAVSRPLHRGCPGPRRSRGEGGLSRPRYTFERHGREVARVSKKWFSLSDTYAIDIDEGEDDVLILAAAVVIDLVSHPDDNG